MHQQRHHSIPGNIQQIHGTDCMYTLRSIHATHVPSSCGFAHQMVGGVPDAEHNEPKHI